MLLLQHEGNFKVDLVARDVAVFDHDVLILDPSALYVPEGLGGPSYALLDGVLEALIRDSADFCHCSNAHIFLSHPFFGCSLTTTTAYIFAYHLKGEAKHIDGRLQNTHRQRPIAPPRSARTAGEEILISSGIMCQAAPGTKGPRRRPGQYSGWDHTPSFAAARESYPSRELLQRCYRSANRG